MSLVARLLLTVAVTAVFSASLTGYLSYRAATERVPRAFGVAGMGRGPGGPSDAGGAMGASRALLAELQDATVRSALLALGAALVAGGWIAWRSSRPITRIAEVTRRYGAGERTLRAEVRGPSEVAALARVFNDTADRLQAEEEQRQRFTADVAHELRTPLTVLKSELEAMQDGLMEADHETMSQLLQQVNVLGRLVADLRLVTLAESGTLDLDRAHVDLAPLARDLGRAFEARAAALGARLEVHAQPAWADVDVERIQQVLNALLDNALRHARDRGTIEVHVRREGPHAVLEVCDDGPGIDPADLPHVFRRFYQADPSRRKDTGGSGLGLSIVAAIVALHHGTVTALPREGGGVRFLVRLPSASL